MSCKLGWAGNGGRTDSLGSWRVGKKTNSNKAHGMNVIPAEVLKAGVIRSLKCFIKSLRIVSQEWIDDYHETWQRIVQIYLHLIGRNALREQHQWPTLSLIPSQTVTR